MLRDWGCGRCERAACGRAFFSFFSILFLAQLGTAVAFEAGTGRLYGITLQSGLCMTGVQFRIPRSCALGKSLGRGMGSATGDRQRVRAFSLSTLTARSSDDDIGDITSRMSDAPVTGGNSRMFPMDSSLPRSAETDIILATGVGQSEQLQDAIDQAMSAAVAKWPTNAEGLPTVPSLAVMFFSSQYAQQGLGRVLPCLLRTFATTGGKPWKVGVNVIGCTAGGFDLEDSSTPAVSLTLIQGNTLAVLPFCVGDEVTGWKESDWSYKAGLLPPQTLDDVSTSMLLFGHPSSLATTDAVLQQLHSAYPSSNKLGGVACGAAGSHDTDMCVIFRKGTGVFNKKGQLIYGEDKNSAKYTSSDDLFFDGGTWRRSGVVGAAISGLVVANVCQEERGSADETLARVQVQASAAVMQEDDLMAVGGLAFADLHGARLLAPHPTGMRTCLEKALKVPVSVAILDKVVVSRESEEDMSVTVELCNKATAINTLFGAGIGPSTDVSEEDLEALESWSSNTLVNSAGQILTIPKYEGPQQKRGVGGKKNKGKRR